MTHVVSETTTFNHALAVRRASALKKRWLKHEVRSDREGLRQKRRRKWYEQSLGTAHCDSSKSVNLDTSDLHNDSDDGGNPVADSAPVPYHKGYYHRIRVKRSKAAGK